MAGVVQTLTLDGLADYCRERGREFTSMDFTKPFKVTQLLVVADIRENFAGSHAPDGTPWAPLKWREGQPLRDKGLLMAASTAQAQVTLTQFELTISNVLDYAGIHQHGGTVTIPEQTRTKEQGPFVFQGRDGRTIFSRRIREHTVTVPARPFMGISEKAQGLIVTAFAEHVEGRL